MSALAAAVLAVPAITLCVAALCAAAHTAMTRQPKEQQ